LGFHYLDSGALYRAVALTAMEAGIDLEDDSRVSAIALNAKIGFKHEQVWLGSRDVTEAIREERVSEGASRVAALRGVRAALRERQRAFRVAPGLVAEGRDMTTIVFPDAVLKVYLTAGADERAGRRYKQLIDKGLSANMTALLQDIHARDARDSGRAVAPLQRSADAVEIDTTAITVEEASAEIVSRYEDALRAP
jgi:cytidylate kinase